MTRIFPFFFSFFLCFVGFSVLAQDKAAGSDHYASRTLSSETYGFSLVMPEGWTEEKSNDAHIIMSFVDPKTENRIEVLKVNLLREEHADILRNAFYEQLVSMRFAPVGDEKEKTMGNITGKSREFDFISSELPVFVSCFSFERNSVSYMVVGYFLRAERSMGVKSMEKTIESISFE